MSTTQEDRILEQVRADIVVAQARLSGIQNEITERVQAAEIAVEEKYKARLVQLEHDYSKKNEELVKKQAYLDDYMVRLDTKDSEISAKVVSVNRREEELKDKSERLEIDISRFNQTLKDAEKSQEKYISDLEVKAKAQIEKDRAQDLREKNLNEKEAGFEIAVKNIENMMADDKTIVARNEAILAKTNTVKASIDEEARAIKESLDMIEKEKQTLIQLSAIKDDIHKFEDEKAKFEKDRSGIIQLSKSVEMRDKKVTEREITANETDKYLKLREREVQAKIDRLEALRKG